jgi:hypothetical protein
MDGGRGVTFFPARDQARALLRASLAHRIRWQLWLHLSRTREQTM